MMAALQAAPAWAAERAFAAEESDKEGKVSKSSAVMSGEQRIEQVYLNLPEVWVYGDGFSLSEVEAGEGYLSQDKLEFVGASPFSETEGGIFYYVMLDISASIPDAYFRSAKEGIQNLQNALGEKDRLILCTFGQEVALAADGNQTVEEMEEILAGLTNKDQETLLFEGIDKVAALADQMRGQCRRQVLLVVSDGEDFATGKKMAGEALAALKDKGLPAYGVCIRGTAKENINSFGEFARTSGGFLRIFQPQEGGCVLTDMADEFQDDICVRYRASSNVVTNKEENFNFQFADDRVLSKAVMNVHWIPDEEAPYLVSGEPVGDRQIRLIFSEPMIGLAGAANYKVRLDGREVAVTGVAYDKEDETRITLTLGDAVKNGVYEVACLNLTDYSMERNSLKGSIQVEIRGVREEEDAVPITNTININEREKFDYTGILFLILSAVVALIAVLIATDSKKRKAAAGKADGGGHGLDSHEVTKAEEKRILDVVISSKGKKSRQAFWELGRRLVVGRAVTCDVVVADIEMSRQHFILEWENGGIFVTDLGSTNGTAVNGTRILCKRRLEPGDHIEAGSGNFTIRW